MGERRSMTRKRKNRKKKRVDGFFFPRPFAGAVVLVVTLALAYVWIGIRCEQVGRDIKALEKDRTELQKKCTNEELRWTRMKALDNLERELARHRIVMTWPRRDQVVRLYDVDRYRDKVARAERPRMHE
jgi:hypothetical protein